ncbi:hypothetical protein [Prauserella muralis]|uniref:hypothetical protein n=1 Tax=Prauserella muralis TaxID=588067 RepID=UPI0011ADEF73|nr:hypothetical protein [Prauserella muralis]TWE23179.1 hypothetical protein FHX69_4439 [Prauserella muralis]
MTYLRSELVLGDILQLPRRPALLDTAGSLAVPPVSRPPLRAGRRLGACPFVPR